MNQPYMPVKAKRDDHETPDELFQKYNDIYHFTLDAAASIKNTKCDKYYTKDDSSLKYTWNGETVWLNPPYDAANLKAFIAKSLSEWQNNRITIIMLLPVKTDQQWWHDLWNLFLLNLDKIEIHWVKGRIKFKGNKYTAPSPSVIVVLKGLNTKKNKPIETKNIYLGIHI